MAKNVLAEKWATKHDEYVRLVDLTEIESVRRTLRNHAEQCAMMCRFWEGTR